LLNLTVSPATAAAFASLTTVDAVEVLAPSAGTTGGLNVTGAALKGVFGGAGLTV
jgi:hypothetical protein